MASILDLPSDNKLDVGASGEPTHAVCACQVDATPRLALCGTDCSDEDESWSDTICVVCFDFICQQTPCTRCGGLG